MIAEPSMPERRPSPGLTLNLNSNNPFRNRAASPAVPSPGLHTPSSAGSRPMSRNPFLSTFEAEFNKEAANSQLIDMSAEKRDSPNKSTYGNTADELFNNLTLDEGVKDKERAAPRGAPNRNGGPPAQGHRPSRSEEEERRLRAGPRGPPRARGPPSSRPHHPSSPERRENRRPRRNSESSMMDKGSLSVEEERKRRERRRERDERAKDGKDSKDGKSSGSRRVRKPHGLDLIDKLDVSGIYGPSLIHHDGPYDAVQPHRNRRKDHRAPMQAFPKDSANNALGGSGPLNKNIDLEAFHGRGAEGFTDFARSADTAPPKRPDLEGRSVSFNPKDRADIIHGEESVGLGTSTFLEGAPASRNAIQRRESENKQALADGGIGRKKSIAQRIRGISQPRRGFGDGNPRITSPESRYGPRTPDTLQAQSAGGMSKQNETNPFFDDYDEAYDKKGAAIRVAEAETRDGPVKSPSSPHNGLTRSITTESMGSPREEKPQSGFLSRVKSLKGGRRARPERPAA